MSFETGVLLSMAIGMMGAVALAGFSIWSKFQEDKEKKQQSRPNAECSQNDDS